MSPPLVTPSLRTQVLQLAHSGVYAICADDVARSTGCTLDAAKIVLAQLASEGALHSPAVTWYSSTPPEDKPLKRKGGNAFVRVSKGERKSKAVEFADVERWLASKEQWPGCTSPLPTARPPAFRERGGRV